MLKRCIEYDHLKNFITSNMIGCLDESSITLTIDTVSILGFISGSNDTIYLTKIINDEENILLNIVIEKLNETI
jgi:hypothetical protein